MFRRAITLQREYRTNTTEFLSYASDFESRRFYLSLSATYHDLAVNYLLNETSIQLTLLQTRDS